MPLPIKKIDNLNKALKTLNFLGINVTIPFKQKVIKELDLIDKNAKNINAVNTLIFENNKIKGYNTDIIGFAEGLKKSKWNKEKPVIIFGAGGAAESILYYLKLEKVKNVILINRTKSRADIILKKYRNVKFLAKINNEIKESGLIINTTSLGMTGYPDLNINFDNVNKSAIVYDIVYNPINTRFIINAKKNNLQTISGLDMFIEQAKASFEIWFKIKPLIDKKLITNIKNKLKEKC